VYGNPPFLGEPLLWNRPEIHAAPIPGAGGIATARAVARYYACLAAGGSLDGVRLCGPETIRRFAAPRSVGPDAIFGDPLAFGIGFELQEDDARMFGPPADAFGHTGAGGSVHGAWPTQDVGFSYCMNEMRPEPADLRGRRLLAALADCLG
jgi:CubicO group peptidase (beta-lactamase class C family)